MKRGLYIFSVRSGNSRIVGDDHELMLPAFKIGLGPGAPSGDIEIMAGPRNEGAWLCGQRDHIILKVNVASTLVLMTSLIATGMTPLEIEVRRLDDPTAVTPSGPRERPRVEPAAAGLEAPANPPAAIASQMQNPSRPRIGVGFRDPNTQIAMVAGPDTPLEHPAWRDARDRVLAAAAAGPATLALLGPTGAGKTWLLRDLALTLRRRGMSVTHIRQGDTTFELNAGAAVLVDEASRMSDETLARVAGQRIGLLVLADLPEFSGRLETLPRPPVVIALAAMKSSEVRRFVTDWVERSAGLNVTLADRAIERLIAHSGGVPGVLTKILSYALTMAGLSGRTSIDGDDVDDAAESRLGALSAPADAIALPAPGSLRPAGARLALESRLGAGESDPAPLVRPGPAVVEEDSSRGGRFLTSRAGYATAAVAAIAASLALGSVVSGLPRRQAPVGQVHIVDPGPIARSPDLDVPRVTALTIAPIAPIPLPGEPDGSSKPEDTVPAQLHDSNQGLMLVARHGDTKKTLYARIYRGVRPPPFAEFAAANPGPLRPGVLVVFPAPPGGWQRR
jgi:hypothetical protein